MFTTHRHPMRSRREVTQYTYVISLRHIVASYRYVSVVFGPLRLNLNGYPHPVTILRNERKNNAVTQAFSVNVVIQVMSP